MNLENFLLFIMKHNTAIIETLIALSLIFVVFMAVRGFLAAKDPEPAASLAGIGGLEETLKKILAQASHIPAVQSSDANQDLADQIEALKLSLEDKQRQIEEMKNQPVASGAAPTSGISEGEKAKIEGQVKELQAKLSEYEIISEDIADLSLYKEQNAKLQQEIAALKQNQGSASPEPVLTSMAQVPEPAIEATEPAIEATEPAIEATEPVVVLAEPAPAIEHVVDDDLMAAFGEAVEKQQDIVDLGSTDVDKMMEEAVSIKTDGPDVDAAQALGTSVDQAKILKEAAALGGAPVEEISEEDKQLMGQFENFVKKSE